MRHGDRLFAIFAPSPEDPAYLRQAELLRNSEVAFAERDLRRTDLLAPDGGDARERYGVGDGGFACVLVGKDGGVKYRFSEPVRPQELYALVDAMPMRRREMRERKRGG